MATFRRVYAEGHYYFLTVVTEHRRPILIDHVELLREAFRHSKAFFDYEIDAISILPDHFHMIILPCKQDDYAKIITSIKTYFSKNLNRNYPTNQSKHKKREAGVWQRRFYEHTIRNDRELQQYRDYVHYNPVKHGWVGRAYDWQYGTFRKFVQQRFYDEDWCSVGFPAHDEEYD